MTITLRNTKGSALTYSELDNNFITVSRSLLKSSAYTAAAGDRIVVTNNTGAVSITLPTASIGGETVEIIDGNDFSTYNVTVYPAAGQSIEGISYYTLNVKGSGAAFVFNANTWKVQYIGNVASSTAKKLSVVATLPGSPDSSTLYFVTG